MVQEKPRPFVLYNNSKTADIRDTVYMCGRQGNAAKFKDSNKILQGYVTSHMTECTVITRAKNIMAAYHLFTTTTDR